MQQKITWKTLPGVLIGLGFKVSHRDRTGFISGSFG